MGVPSGISDHIDVRVCATVFGVGCANFEYSGWPARFVYQMVAIWIAAPERRTLPGAQSFFAGLGDQRQLAFEYPDKFVLMTVPMTLAGPSSRLDNRQVNAEVGQPRRSRQPLAGLSDARLIEGRRISAP